MITFARLYIIICIVCILFGCKEKVNPRLISFSPFSPKNNLAQNLSGSKYPNALESDDGWGGAYYKNHLIDGLRQKNIYWNYGYAFTGGVNDYVDTCGWRQLVINFGQQVEFNRVVIWRNPNDNLTAKYYLQFFDNLKGEWNIAKEVIGGEKIANELKKLFFSKVTGYDVVWATEDTFPTVKSDRFRLYLNNCDVDVVWFNEVEIYFDKPGDRPNCLIFNNNGK